MVIGYSQDSNQQLLNLYSDIAVLNWFPISDWDKGFGQVDFTVDGLDASQGGALFTLVILKRPTC